MIVMEDLQEIQNAWDSHRGGWDFDARPFLRVSRYAGFTSVIFPLKNTVPERPLPCITFQLERGTFDGKPHSRIIGTIDGTDISKVVSESWI